MLWLAGRLVKNDEDRKPIVLAACACARLALQYVPKGELRPLHAIETAEAWCRGEATIEEVRAARAAAYAAYAADAAYAAAADAADAYAAAAAAAYAAAAAAAAAAYAAYAADAAAYAAARTKVLAECADIVRKMLPLPKLPRVVRKSKRAA
jgi:hypothetical protein